MTVTTLPANKSGRASLNLTRGQIVWIVALLAGHVVLAILMRTLPLIATLHALACLAGGLIYAAVARRVRNVAVVVAYMVGCEVLWRMTNASVFWEFGKYSIAAVLLVALVRIQWRRNRILALSYLALLLPSVALTWATLDLDVARQEVSFNMSGPLALTLTVLFFSNIRLSSTRLVAMYLALIAPVVGIGGLSLFLTTAQNDIEFVNAANAATSGGFGPNQVSAMLGLAVMLLLLTVLARKLPWSVTLPAFVLATVLATESALTFSRGGIVLAFAGTAGAMFFLLRGNRRGRAAVVFVVGLSFVLGKYVVEPRLEEFTKGELGQRYSDTRSSGRDLFLRSELELFEEHPILGVGPGMGMRLRAERGEFYGPSHTEYSRMLAEHGLLGAFALICLLALGVRAIRSATETSSRALASAMLIWAGLFLMINGMRIAAPAFVFGLAFLRTLPAIVQPAATKQVST